MRGQVRMNHCKLDVFCRNIDTGYADLIPENLLCASVAGVDNALDASGEGGKAAARGYRPSQPHVGTARR